MTAMLFYILYLVHILNSTEYIHKSEKINNFVCPQYFPLQAHKSFSLLWGCWLLPTVALLWAVWQGVRQGGLVVI